MPDATDTTRLERARTAAVTGDWPHAYQLLVEADAIHPLDGDDRELGARPCGKRAGW
jgi:hypothetical protein